MCRIANPLGGQLLHCQLRRELCRGQEERTKNALVFTLLEIPLIGVKLAGPAANCAASCAAGCGATYGRRCVRLGNNASTPVGISKQRVSRASKYRLGRGQNLRAHAFENQLYRQLGSAAYTRQPISKRMFSCCSYN
jgi:hypothetical protein